MDRPIGDLHACRLNLADGRFLAPIPAKSPGINACGISNVHGLFSCAGEDGILECFDLRQRSSIGAIDAAAAAGAVSDCLLLLPLLLLLCSHCLKPHAFLVLLCYFHLRQRSSIGALDSAAAAGAVSTPVVMQNVAVLAVPALSCPRIYLQQRSQAGSRDQAVHCILCVTYTAVVIVSGKASTRYMAKHQHF